MDPKKKKNGIFMYRHSKIGGGIIHLFLFLKKLIFLSPHIRTYRIKTPRETMLTHNFLQMVLELTYTKL